MKPCYYLGLLIMSPSIIFTEKLTHRKIGSQRMGFTQAPIYDINGSTLGIILWNMILDLSEIGNSMKFKQKILFEENTGHE